MSDTRTPPPSADLGEAARSAIIEHDTIHARLTELRSQSFADLDAVRERLRAVAELLRSHFEGEEAQGGLYEVIVEHAPRLHNTARRLCSEHSAIAAELAELLEWLAGSANPEAARRRISAFCDRVLAHEAAENRLHQEALYMELGTGD